MARSPLTETIKRVQGMVFYVQENLNQEEYMLFLDMVDPQPEPEAPVKQTRKRRGRSARAESLSSAIAKTPKVEADARCVAQVPGLDVLCGEREDALIHDPKGGYASYHPFVSSAPPVTRRSSRKTGSTKGSELPIANSEIPPAIAGSAVQEASAGD